MSVLLSVEDLNIRFSQGDRTVHAVRGVSFQVEKGKTLALVGESGAGKSVAALSILGLLPEKGRSVSGSVRFKGRELVGMEESKLRCIRGNEAAVIFQEPGTSLNPLHTVEKQIGEVLSLHRGLGRREALAESVRLLELVGIHEPEKRVKAYPHELSGGQRQRVMIAMAVAAGPDLLIADEPTTALDVTVQAQVLKLLKDLQAQLGMAILMITHDLEIVRHFADTVCVMKEGAIVETAPAGRVFSDPAHRYTRHLVSVGNDGVLPKAPVSSDLLFEARNIRVRFPLKKSFLKRNTEYLHAVDGVSLRLREGECLGVVGESGSGKSTLALALLRLVESRGEIVFNGRRTDTLGGKALATVRKDLQVVFQDPYGSLSPRMSVRQIIGEGLARHLSHEAVRHEQMIREAMDAVGLRPGMLDRYPHEFSGGERQRISIARALVLNPRMIVLDEPTSALDRSVQFQIAELLRRVQEARGLTYIFISHDLRIVRSLCTSVLVMNRGKVVESGETDRVFSSPSHPCTRELLAASAFG